tara:strand:+ start:236 stop:1108 length:873 start_codon:yes stop_codon:yes gene_type:complete
MKKIIILMPVYQDWDSLKKVLEEIDSIIQNIKDFEYSCLIINDGAQAANSKIIKPKSFKKLKIINMRENRGHARCNAFGLRYINSNISCDYVIVMDSDGEDRPAEIKELLKKITESPETSVVARRIKRSEGLIFKSLYQIHKLITFIFTGHKVNFGNYSCLIKKDIDILYNKPSLWSSYSGTVKKYLSKLNEIKSIRGQRYYGPSKMSLFNLIIHSFSIIAVFKNVVFLRSALFIVILSFLQNLLGFTVIFLQILIVIFNLFIFGVSLRENEKDLVNSDKNILNEENIVQ